MSIIHVWCPPELGECKVCPAQAIHLLPCGAPPPHPTMGERLHLLPYVWRLVVSGSWLQHKCSVLSLPSLDIGSHIFTPQSAQLSKFMLIHVHWQLFKILWSLQEKIYRQVLVSLTMTTDWKGYSWYKVCAMSNRDLKIETVSRVFLIRLNGSRGRGVHARRGTKSHECQRLIINVNVNVSGSLQSSHSAFPPRTFIESGRTVS